MIMQDAIDGFLLAKRSENSSPCTIRAYRADLEDLSNFLGREHGPEALTREAARGFLVLLHKRGALKATAVRKLAAIKSFIRWLHCEGIINEESFEKITSIKRPRTPDILPDVPSAKEMKRLLTGDFPTAFPARDRLLIELMYGAGLRVSEAAQIKLSDLRLEQDAILIHGKGGPYGKNSKQRLVPLNPSSRRTLELYMTERNEALKKQNLETEALFFAVRDRCGGNGRSLNSRSVHRMVLQMSKVRGLSPMHPHLLRHACATHLLDNGCPLDVISQLLGHDNLDVTAHYAQVSTRLMLAAYNGAHPHALGKKPFAADSPK